MVSRAIACDRRCLCGLWWRISARVARACLCIGYSGSACKRVLFDIYSFSPTQGGCIIYKGYGTVKDRPENSHDHARRRVGGRGVHTPHPQSCQSTHQSETRLARAGAVENERRELVKRRLGRLSRRDLQRHALATHAEEERGVGARGVRGESHDGLWRHRHSWSAQPQARVGISANSWGSMSGRRTVFEVMSTTARAGGGGVDGGGTDGSCAERRSRDGREARASV